ncbi:unnamed protein product [Colias eurytheme]|nr:unnamed protein product [Colias eurytheme]
MSIQRTPPSNQFLATTSNSSVHYNSDSALNLAGNSSIDENNYFYITKRQKRTIDDIQAQSHSPISEIKNMFSEIKSNQEEKYDSINKTMLTIINQNMSIQTSVATLTTQYEDLLKKMATLEAENSSYRNQVQSLENKVEYLENFIRKSTIEIRNLPKQNSENKRTLTSSIQQLGDTLGLETRINESEIRDIYRLKSEAVVVEFTTSNRKESILYKFKSLNKSCEKKDAIKHATSKDPWSSSLNLYI